uniref:Uncharacterized protein n=1 Tax=Steinernema glaseri TaxID=37863 RepID=A0A1I8ASD4_9BILA
MDPYVVSLRVAQTVGPPSQARGPRAAANPPHHTLIASYSAARALAPLRRSPLLSSSPTSLARSPKHRRRPTTPSFTASAAAVVVDASKQQSASLAATRAPLASRRRALIDVSAAILLPSGFFRTSPIPLSNFENSLFCLRREGSHRRWRF